MKLLVKFLQRQKIRRNILPNRRVRASTGFDGANAFRFKRLVLREELTVLPRENVIRNCGDAHRFPQSSAELQHQGRLSAAYRSADANGERALVEVTIK